MMSVEEVLKERGTRYGQFVNQAGIAQGIHSVIEYGMGVSGKTKHKDFHVDELEALHMIVNKIARIVNGDPHYSDSWRDIAGYATLVADRLDNDSKQNLLESQNERGRDAEEARPDSPDNEPSEARGDAGQEEDNPTTDPS
jgi:hypothetical protein